ncbi:hypothetical protein A2422_02485 [Candidatus Woesebacteria bacterium RIFOXYC1_FULL_31_51]|uniref:DUF6922 domain-containing protein n=1 Tax=Candidatus Woesebacteria bacterium GW2011_GWC2_31_9 TaxID=1618586 RepID=A0A0F9YHX1_9BACT|nr:MAG: Uncharacterized protein UR17_C0001G0001 [Candidatus Woesebacteria bacterium GW2011_GWF1_31_35]KKP23501.1 MAG: hypothetical protein UR11_C0001G0475 [Candidatus Woesebacteria bacterium GW2011_GWC1_30_29]KKP26478.1 MAG: hypothetical protein UR13_C0004G0092 [Candidatus Woesebacteria bacterium GW2011_GWD1_31_12]KKP27777.1 MAG: hypothetical protein UR16_C0002G0107 [Candidatus Woesebacteria bacterium GW2011_GWB1_31_29]KKP31099.1 MAG: hypothetical protein UR21_C0016G0017 [Candidatus Woesebacter
MIKIPLNLQSILWSKDIKNLDLQKDKIYIIHQILAYGTWDNIKWLFNTYDTLIIKKIFSLKPEKDYSEKSYNFAKNILLEINNNLDKTKYVKTFPRFIG